MLIKIIGCASSMNEVRWLGGFSEADSEFLDYSYHANPTKLREKLQELINQSQSYDLIVLTYSRCSNAVIGLVSPKVPILMPETHDCIGLLVGSNEKHIKFVKENVGTYFFSQGWLDYGRTPYAEFLEYKEQYGEEMARKFITALYGRYKKAVLIKTPGMKNLEEYRRQVREIADFFGWQVEEMEGNIDILSSLIKGVHGPGTILVPPGKEITENLLRGANQI